MNMYVYTGTELKAVTDNHCSTAVLAGLVCIADKPEILAVDEVPVSLGLRSDPDESTDEEEPSTVVRMCTQGQNTNGTANVRDRFQHHIPYISSSVLLTMSLHRLACQSLACPPEYSMKPSSKAGMLRILPIRISTK
jgi:hypothetical protein